MKKASVCFFITLFLTSLLCSCAPVGHPNILMFTDNLKKERENSTLSLSDYYVTDHTYKLVFSKENTSVLLTAEENEKGEIKKIRLSLSKTDKKGKALTLTDNQIAFFREKVNEALAAFTLFERERCEELTKKILPLKSKDFSKTGELTMEAESFHLVYYSNKICCQFSATNTFLEELETTQKPVSKPFFEVTAKVSQ